MAILLEVHAQPTEILDIAWYSWVAETLHAKRVLQTTCDEYVQTRVQAGFEGVENTENEIMQETTHIRLPKIDELAVWDSLFRTEQNGVNIESEKNDSIKSEDVIFMSSSTPDYWQTCLK